MSLYLITMKHKMLLSQKHHQPLVNLLTIRTIRFFFHLYTQNLLEKQLIIAYTIQVGFANYAMKATLYRVMVLHANYTAVLVITHYSHIRTYHHILRLAANATPYVVRALLELRMIAQAV